MLERLLDLLLPVRCGGCGQFGALYCERCRQRTRRLREPLCRRCGAEVEFAKARCGCRDRLHALGRLRSVARYEGPLEKAIQRFKYEGRRPLVKPLASLLLDRLAVDGPSGELVTWVPLHPRRQRERGYNQSELLAREVASRIGFSNFPGHLVRTRDTRAQVGLDRRRRLVNVAGAFAWKGADLQRRSVLLIDDVATTGATLEACAAALRAAGAGVVTGLTIARVQL